MRTLIYKRTHNGDPDPKAGVFGNHDCMGSVRDWTYDAVIGVGGIGEEPERHGIAGKLTWIGIGPLKLFDSADTRGPKVTFGHFLYFGENGPLLAKKYPALAKHMYETHRRHSMHAPFSAGGPALDRDVKAILRLAMTSLPSNGPANFRAFHDTCRTQLGQRTACPPRRSPSKSRDCA